MRIGGFTKQTLIDYPGKLAAMIFTQGCNFRCGYCHNPQLVLPHLINESTPIATEEVLQWIQTRKNWLDAVVISGGEPTLHNDLPEFIAQIKGMGLAVKLDTNGSNPLMLKKLIREHLVDYVAMDIKHLPSCRDYEKVIGLKNTEKLIRRIEQSMIILQQAGIDYEFRTTYIPGIHTPEAIEQIKSLLLDENKYTVNEYRDGYTIAHHQATGQTITT
ncbi:anaerobic ribonucleoside-triphosphate reductase activating protein [Marinilabiliaceae bacterium JC017]|nr:anaerobic ribonucleoside-triphosphate reductase activating protein [Marinilabiliaceae bacterium JC017]